MHLAGNIHAFGREYPCIWPGTSMHLAGNIHAFGREHLMMRTLDRMTVFAPATTRVRGHHVDLCCPTTMMDGRK